MRAATTILIATLCGCPSGPATDDTSGVNPWLQDDTGGDSDTAVDLNCDGDLACERCTTAGYHDDVAGLTAASAIRSALRAEMTGLTNCAYSLTTTFMFLELDNEASIVEGFYTGRTTTAVGQKPDASTDMNTEHTWPQSLGASDPPAKCDLHHLRPVDVEANSKRASHPFGIVTGSTEWSAGGSKLGLRGSDLVFEPRSVVRGDVARGMLYFALQYDYTLPADELQLYRDWHAADPVSDLEFERTLAIRDYQAHANPFVACPGLVATAW